MTQLLVSVRNAVEAIAAVSGGADIIDVKEPNHGSLGCATPEAIREIADALNGIKGTRRPLSVALGELAEWRSGDLHSLRSAIQAAAPQFLKLGLAEARSSQPAPSWIVDWQRVRAMIFGAHAWVGVAYADHELANSPTVDLVLQAAIEAGCRILLIDTHTKNGTSMLDHLSLEQLQAVRRQTSKHGLKLALAGGVVPSRLPSLLALNPDIIAVRGAVSECGDRTAIVREDLVRSFRRAMDVLL